MAGSPANIEAYSEELLTNEKLAGEQARFTSK